MLNNKLDQPCLLLATLKTSHINYETKNQRLFGNVVV